MNRALENSLLSKPNVKGILCADVNGLCIAGMVTNANLYIYICIYNNVIYIHM
mgnify:FL=1